MSQWEHEERCRLREAYKLAQAAYEDALEEGSSADLHQAIEGREGALATLEAWENHVTQVIQAPSGMVAVFERRDGLEEHIPVSYLGLHRSGRVYPYIFVGNCLARRPTSYPNFLRVDFAGLMQTREAALDDIGREHTEPAPRNSALWPD